VAETGDIVAGATGIGAFFGALFGAWKIFKPATQPEGGDLKVLANKIAEIERRQNAMDERFDEVFHLLGDVQRTMATCQTDIREALTRLQERRK
jgi:hypothetical protein